MSNLPSVKQKIQVEGTRFRSAVSESLEQTIGKSINYLIDSTDDLETRVTDLEAVLPNIQVSASSNGYSLTGSTAEALITNLSVSITLTRPSATNAVMIWLESANTTGTDLAYFTNSGAGFGPAYIRLYRIFGGTTRVGSFALEPPFVGTTAVTTYMHPGAVQQVDFGLADGTYTYECRVALASSSTTFASGPIRLVVQEIR